MDNIWIGIGITGAIVTFTLVSFVLYANSTKRIDGVEVFFTSMIATACAMVWPIAFIPAILGTVVTLRSGNN